MTDTDGRSLTMPLEPKSVAQFHREFIDGLRRLDIEVRICPRPVEVADAIPFDADDQLADPDADVLDFFRSTSERGAVLRDWDRATLEPAVLPEQPPKRPWSTTA